MKIKKFDLGSIPAQSTTEACSFSTGVRVVNEASKQPFTEIRPVEITRNEEKTAQWPWN